VAVKIVSHDGDVGHRMDVLRESLLSANIQHPNVVSTYKARQRLAPLRPYPTLTCPRGALGAAPSGGRMVCLTARRADKALQPRVRRPPPSTRAPRAAARLRKCAGGPRFQRACPVWRHLRAARQPARCPPCQLAQRRAHRACTARHRRQTAAQLASRGMRGPPRPDPRRARAQVHTILHSAPQKPDVGPSGEPLDGHASGGSRGQLQTPHSMNSNDGDEEIMETWLVLGAPPCKLVQGAPGPRVTRQGLAHLARPAQRWRRGDREDLARARCAALQSRSRVPGLRVARHGLGHLAAAGAARPASPCAAFTSGPELICGRAPWHSFGAVARLRRPLSGSAVRRYGCPSSQPPVGGAEWRAPVAAAAARAAAPAGARARQPVRGLTPGRARRAEFCDQGNLDQAVTSGRFANDLETVYMCAARPTLPYPTLPCTLARTGAEQASPVLPC